MTLSMLHIHTLHSAAWGANGYHGTRIKSPGQKKKKKIAPHFMGRVRLSISCVTLITEKLLFKSSPTHPGDAVPLITQLGVNLSEPNYRLHLTGGHEGSTTWRVWRFPYFLTVLPYNLDSLANNKCFLFSWFGDFNNMKYASTNSTVCIA